MRAAIVAAAAGWLAMVGPGHAADITVFTGGSMLAPLQGASTAFEAASGNHVRFVSGTTADIMRRLDAGEVPDVVVISDEAIAGLGKAGRVVPGSRRDLASPVIGVAVRSGDPRPDLSTPEALKASLLKAKSIVYPDPARGAVTGLFITGLFDRMGIAEPMKAKTVVRPTGAAAAQATAEGQADMVMTFISELKPEKRLAIAGLLPSSLQIHTVYAAAVWREAPSPEAARAFVAYAASPAARPALVEAGVEPVAR